MSDEPIGLYQDPEIYDILHWPGTAAEFRGLMRAAKAFVKTRTRGPWTLLEPACGTGRLLRLGAREGYRVAGFDLSREMIEYANAKLPPSPGSSRLRHRLFVADMENFAAGLGRERIDLALCPINTIRHLESDGAMLRHFSQMTGVLKPGGVYLVGITVTMYGIEAESEDVWEGARGRTRVKQVISFIPPARGRFEQVHSHLIIRRGRRSEHRDSSYRLRCYSLGQWKRLISRSALKVLGVVDAAGKRIEPPELGYGVYVLGK